MVTRSLTVKKLKPLCVALLFLTTGATACWAQSVGEDATALMTVETPLTTGFLPTAAASANWVFSGVAASENGESYDYFFHMRHDGPKFYATVALFDAQTKKVIFQEESQAEITNTEKYSWQVGKTFLSFNPITASWILSLTNPDKSGFNFKIDMLTQTKPPSQDLRRGVEFLVSQTGQMNGHIQLPYAQGVQEQFVTAKNAWFRQLWANKEQEHQQLNGVLCQFNDGSGFYSMNMQSADALRGAVAGRFDEQGVPAAISQFIHVQQGNDGPWHIRVSSPHLDLVLTNALQQSAIIAGFVVENDKQGFCMLSQDAIGAQTTA